MRALNFWLGLAFAVLSFYVMFVGMRYAMTTPGTLSLLGIAIMVFGIAGAFLAAGFMERSID